MIQRFSAELDNASNAYFVRDNEGIHYNLPEKAVVLFFKQHSDAHQVAVLLNQEWERFKNNPS